jgi:hypothetical protein
MQRRHQLSVGNANDASRGIVGDLQKPYGSENELVGGSERYKDRMPDNQGALKCAITA